MMKYILKNYFSLCSAIYILVNIIPSVKIVSGLKDFFSATIIMVLLMIVVRPLINIILLPINLITFNLFSWLVNIFLFYLWVVISRNVSVESWIFPGINIGGLSISSINFSSWQTIIISAVVFTFLLQIINLLIK